MSTRPAARPELDTVSDELIGTEVGAEELGVANDGGPAIPPDRASRVGVRSTPSPEDEILAPQILGYTGAAISITDISGLHENIQRAVDEFNRAQRAQLVREQKEHLARTRLQIKENEELTNAKINFCRQAFQVIDTNYLVPAEQAFLTGNIDAPLLAEAHKLNFGQYVALLGSPEYIKHTGMIAATHLALLAELSDWSSAKGIQELRKEIHDVLVRPGELLGQLL